MRSTILHKMIQKNWKKSATKLVINRPERAGSKEKVQKPRRSIHQHVRLVEVNNFCLGSHMENSKIRYEKCEKPREKGLWFSFQAVL